MAPQGPLTPEQREMVERTLPDLPRLLRGRWFRAHVRRLGYEDAYQIGAMALMRASQTYDPAKAEEFTTYADWWLRHYLTRAVPGTALMRDGEHRFAGGRPGARQVYTLGLSDGLDGANDEGPQELAEANDVVLACLAVLSPREHAVVRLVALGNTYAETGARLGIGRESARQSYVAAVEKLKAASGGSRL